MAGRKRDYIRRKRGTMNFSVRFQYPDSLQASACAMYGVDEWPNEKEWSLGTPDELEARRRASSAISEHLDLLAFHAAYTSPEEAATFAEVFEVEPGTNEVGPDGISVVADKNEIITIPPGGAIQRRLNRRRFEIRFKEGFQDPRVKAAAQQAAITEKAKVRNLDREMLDTYIASSVRAGKLGGEQDRHGDQASLRRTLDDFKFLFDGKALKNARRKDVSDLIDHMLEARDLTPARVKKLLSYMRAAINDDMVEAHHTRFEHNPFDRFVVPDDEGSQQRPPFTEAEFAAIRADLPNWEPEQRLLWVWHAASSIRPVGLYSIKSDDWEEAEDQDTGRTYRTRYIQINKDKGKFGRRCLPIPQAVLDLGLLPERIAGPLFKTDRAILLASINRRIGRIKVGQQAITKTLYSARHRARDRLRGTEEEMRRAIMGHTRQITDSHDRYGHGYPLWRVKTVIDRIGY
jgi:hypothetical protein